MKAFSLALIAMTLTSQVFAGPGCNVVVPAPQITSGKFLSAHVKEKNKFNQKRDSKLRSKLDSNDFVVVEDASKAHFSVNYSSGCSQGEWRDSGAHSQTYHCSWAVASITLTDLSTGQSFKYNGYDEAFIFQANEMSAFKDALGNLPDCE